MGQPVWQQVPGEYRSQLRRLIVTQGDTEPASVEQQRLLGHTCPSLYDLRNLFQVNVEEGRHLWAMVYLLHAYFGRDGREEAEELLARHSGDADKPRILTTFNEPISDWLSFFCFTYFTDRDGKYQLKSLAESAFDPLSRTCRFMLTEEAHHMFVGETGIGRVVKRTLEVMKELGTDDPRAIRAHGAIDLPTLQSTSTSGARPRSTCSAPRSRPMPRALRQRHQGPARRRPVRGSRLRRATYELETPQGKENGEPAQCPERGDARVLPQGLRDRPEALELQIERAGLRLPPGAAQPALPPLDRRLGQCADRPAGQADQLSEEYDRLLPGLASERGRPRVRAAA